MTRPTPEVAGESVVLLGSFNPAIFQPYWFSSHGLIREDEAEAAKIEVMVSELSSFSTEWFDVQVLSERFTVTTTLEPYEGLRDLVLGTFELLNHTPLRAMGINRDVHFRVSSEDEWNGLGWRIVPPENWEAILKRPGMRSAIVEGMRPDDYKGFIRVTVQPSIKFPLGVYIQINDHYEIADFDPAKGASELMATLEKDWDASQKRASEIISRVLELR